MILFTEVKDANNCKTEGSEITIGQPEVLVITSEVKEDVTNCYGDENGTVTITTAGGTGTIEYSVNNGENFFDNEGIFTGLAEVIYNIEAKDENMCEVIGSEITIEQPNENLLLQMKNLQT